MQGHTLKPALLLMAGLVATVAAAQQATPRGELGSSFNIQYGTVESVDVGKVAASAAPGKGATVGGMLGLTAASHEHDARGAAEGAITGALISGLIAKHQKETAPNAYTYTVALAQGGETKLVTETPDIRQGDCVSIETGQTANIRRVASEFCASPSHPAVNDPAVQAGAQQEAAECHTAKQLALQAKTEADMDVAMKKVRIFCES